jgi:hypothetical protein
MVAAPPLSLRRQPYANRPDPTARHPHPPIALVNRHLFSLTYKLLAQTRPGVHFPSLKLFQSHAKAFTVKKLAFYYLQCYQHNTDSLSPFATDLLGFHLTDSFLQNRG